MEAGNSDEDEDMITKTNCLIGNYPNPFNPQTFISYNLIDNNQVYINIYNIKGELVRSLVNADQTAGDYTVCWDGKDNLGTSAGSGVYFYKLETKDFTATRRMVMLK